MFKNAAGLTARIGRYAWDIKSPLFGLYFVSIVGRVGVSKYFRSHDDAKAYLCSLGFVPTVE